MTGAIPRALMTDAELDTLAHDTGEHGEQLYVPTAAGVAHAGSHLGVPAPTPYTELIRPARGVLTSESTGTEKCPEGRERPEGDARRLRIRGAGLLARQPWGFIALAAAAIIYIAALTLYALAELPS